MTQKDLQLALPAIRDAAEHLMHAGDALNAVESILDMEIGTSDLAALCDFQDPKEAQALTLHDFQEFITALKRHNGRNLSEFKHIIKGQPLPTTVARQL